MEISSKENYADALKKVYDLMNKGEHNLTSSELKGISKLAKEIEQFEDKVLNIMPRIEYSASGLPAEK